MMNIANEKYIKKRKSIFGCLMLVDTIQTQNNNWNCYFPIWMAATAVSAILWFIFLIVVVGIEALELHDFSLFKCLKTIFIIANGGLFVAGVGNFFLLLFWHYARKTKRESANNAQFEKSSFSQRIQLNQTRVVNVKSNECQTHEKSTKVLVVAFVCALFFVVVGLKINRVLHRWRVHCSGFVIVHRLAFFSPYSLD